jgi:hypothetical protein
MEKMKNKIKGKTLFTILLFITLSIVQGKIESSTNQKKNENQQLLRTRRQSNKRRISGNINYCGTTWNDANKNCGTACPGGVDSECPAGQSCFGGITSCNNNPVPAPVAAPTATVPNNYCGTTWNDANKNCGTACPGGFNSECPAGQSCFGGITSCDENPTVSHLFSYLRFF